MEYEKKYKEALERMKSWANGEHPECFSEAQKTAEFIFPELKESEDERIRKAIIGFFELQDDNTTYYFVPKKDIIAWLEKQGNKSVNIDVESMVSSYEQRLESQGGTKYTPLVNMCLTSFRHGVENVLEELNLKKLEKQEDNKPTDKVEPKFHEDDWIVSNEGIFKITHYEDEYGYELTDTTGCVVHFVSPDYVESNFHLWTIQEAKDGDVLCYETKDDFRIFIYKEGHIHYHCCYSNEHLTPVESFFVLQKHQLCYIHPATKEQRELLFSKMNEAEYEWDAEKKEVKKIEVVSKESEDERIRKAIHIYLDWLDGRKDYAPKGIYSIKDMVAWVEKQKGD